MIAAIYARHSEEADGLGLPERRQRSGGGKDQGMKGALVGLALIGSLAAVARSATEPSGLDLRPVRSCLWLGD
jgi:hypothetical protein